MTSADDDERLVLAHARAGLSPSTTDRARVFRALGTALAAGLAVAPSPVSAEPFASSAWKTWVARLALPAALASGGAGYAVGYHAGVEQGRASTSARPTAPAPAIPPRQPDDVAPDQATPLAPIAKPEPLAPARAEVSAPIPSREPAQDAGLDEEVRQLRRIERALRDENPRYTLALLFELDRQVPRGQLTEERHAARAMARCQLGGDGAELVRQFSNEHPTSGYLARVKQMCSPSSYEKATDPAPPGDSSMKNGRSE